MSQGKYYWKFKAVVNEMLIEQNYCPICKSSKNLGVHHLTHCNSSQKAYADKKNLTVICRMCHMEYHQRYDKVNPQTLLEFTRNKTLESLEVHKIEEIRLQLRDYQDMFNYLLQLYENEVRS